MLLKSLPDKQLPRSARKRILLAEAMLFDRMCPGGGWNAGNPMIYNVAGIPRVLPTAWALLALQNHGQRREVTLSLDWLAHAYHDIQSPGSLAVASLCLSTMGKEFPSLESLLRARLAVNDGLMNVTVMAWAAMALAAVRS
jgi:hypothetical protein